MSKTATQVNKPLLLKVLAYIEEFPENWDQQVWAQINPEKKWVPDDICGTSFCFAGHTLASSGYVPYFPSINPGKSVLELFGIDDYDSDDPYQANANYFIPVELAKRIRKGKKNPDKAPSWKEIDEAQVHVSYKAAEILGISEDQAQQLFDGDNDLQQIRNIIFELISE